MRGSAGAKVCAPLENEKPINGKWLLPETRLQSKARSGSSDPVVGLLPVIRRYIRI